MIPPIIFKLRSSNLCSYIVSGLFVIIMKTSTYTYGSLRHCHVEVWESLAKGLMATLETQKAMWMVLVKA